MRVKCQRRSSVAFAVQITGSIESLEEYFELRCGWKDWTDIRKIVKEAFLDFQIEQNEIHGCIEGGYMVWGEEYSDYGSIVCPLGGWAVKEDGSNILIHRYTQESFDRFYEVLET